MRTYFHGGTAGLNVGDLVRPAVSLGISHSRTLNQPRYTPRRVYITRIRWYAELFANSHRGDVYEVRPVGHALPDLDARGSFHCPCAEVVAVVARHPVPMPAEAGRILPMGATR